jgi:DNA helicase II / ATP-dependent DNA helicase PcrA
MRSSEGRSGDRGYSSDPASAATGSSMFHALHNLNDSQREAVTATEGALLVVAGPGTGKTLTLVRRIAFLVEQGVRPEQILAVTFTNRAAKEMRDRAHAFLGAAARSIFIGTLHRLGLTIMRRCMETEFVVLGRDEQVELLKEITGKPVRKAEDTAERISRIKGLVEEPDHETGVILAAYEKALGEWGAVDFDDLIGMPATMLAGDNSAVLPGAADRYIMVDEYQDINPAQYRFLRALTGDGGNFCAVGDADQAIYAFRGADVTNFLNFEADFPQARRVILKDNYRSTGTIIGASTGLIGKNRRRIEKDLVPSRGAGSPVTVVSVPDDRGEGEFIAQEIESRIGGTSHYRMLTAGRPQEFPEGPYGFGDFAVISRTNGQARAVEEVLSLAGIPCQVVGGRMPTRLKRMIEALRACLSDLSGDVDAGALVKRICEEQSLTREYGLYVDLIAATYEALLCRQAISAVIDELSLLTSTDLFDPRAEAVTLLTAHGAKGLEFKVVFIVGCENGLIPFIPANNEYDEEEERRLFYVGMTRAKDDLFLLHSRKRLMHGRLLDPAPSPFLGDLPPHLVRTVVVPDRPRKPNQGRQLELF